MRKVKCIVVLALSATLFLAGCKTNDVKTEAMLGTAKETKESEETKVPVEEYEEVAAVETLDTKGYALAWEKDFIDFYEKGFKVSIYINAEKDVNGLLAFDDGQNWMACTEIGDENYYIFPDEFIQLGYLECSVYLDEESNPYMLLTSSRTASYSVTEFKYMEGKLFKKVILEKSNLNYIGNSDIR